LTGEASPSLERKRRPGTWDEDGAQRDQPDFGGHGIARARRVIDSTLAFKKLHDYVRRRVVRDRDDHERPPGWIDIFESGVRPKRFLDELETTT
jgi:hypothetical protein